MFVADDKGVIITGKLKEGKNISLQLLLLVIKHLRV